MRTTAAFVIALLGFSAAANAQPVADYTLEVIRAARGWGDSRGTLVFTTDGVEFRTASPKDARKWTYDGIKQLQIRSAKEIAVLTFEDQGRVKFGADRTFRFKTIGAVATADLVDFVLRHTDRPVVTALLPHLDAAPRWRAPVKHERQGRGSDGTLVMYDEGLAYLTTRESEARFWRFPDLFAVLRMDRYRIALTAFEGGGGAVRPFVFQLKSTITEDDWDLLWNRINAPAPLGDSGRPR